jgi:predicted transcriptional regulator
MGTTDWYDYWESQMSSDKFSISLPSSLAAELETLARRDGVSRSAVVREASGRYVAERKSLEKHRLRHASVDAALAGFDEIASAWGDDPRQGMDYLAEVRADDTVTLDDSGAEADE